jgi:hypothetical protein
MVQIKLYIRAFIDLITWPYRYIKEQREYKKKITALREKDPFIYK